MLSRSELHFIAILIAAVVSAGLGALWYSPNLLGPAWMKAHGKTQDELGSPGASIAASVVSCLVSAARWPEFGPFRIQPRSATLWRWNSSPSA